MHSGKNNLNLVINGSFLEQKQQNCTYKTALAAKVVRFFNILFFSVAEGSNEYV
jgi:hypothetical protein